MSKCSCKPKDSGRDPKCKRCHRAGYTAVHTRHDPVKPAEVKQHKALPTRDLPFVRETEHEEKVEKAKEDPYENIEDRW